VYPALAVVDALGKMTDILWVGATGGLEARLVERAGLPFESVPAAGLHGVGWRTLPGNLAAMARGIRAARRILSDFEPDVLFFTGGFVGGPVAWAGRHIPSVTLVPDIEPALSQRMIGRLADRICVSTEASLDHYRRREKLVVTGYPSRFAGRAWPVAEARQRLGLSDDRPVVLVVGGSTGARSINRAVWAGLPGLLAAAQLVHLVGERDWAEAQPHIAALTTEQAAHYHPFAYLHDEMGWALAAADLAVSRAGASAIGDYPLFGLPAVLVPYPHAWRYQRTNAAYLAKRGAAITIDDQRLNYELPAAVVELLGDGPRLMAMAEAARRLARPDAAERIAVVLRQTAGQAGAP